MKKEELEMEFPILKEAEQMINRFSSLPFSNMDVKFLERLTNEYRYLALRNKKMEKQIRLLKILLKRKGK